MQERQEYLELIGISSAMTSNYAQQLTLADIEYVLNTLRKTLEPHLPNADDIIISLIEENHDLVLYEKEHKLSKYCKELNAVLTIITRNATQYPAISTEYQLDTSPQRVQQYATLENIIALKQTLSQKVNKNRAASLEEITPDTLEEYKARLLDQTDLNPIIVNALTKGKNGRYVGNNMIAQEDLRRHVKAKIGSKIPSRKFEKEFDTTIAKLRRENALLELKPGWYSIQPDPNKIRSEPLREYLTLTFHPESYNRA